MKAVKVVLCSLTCIILLFVSSHSFAVLYDVGDGTILQVRDDGTRLMWLEDANLALTEAFGVSGIQSNGTMPLTTAFDWISAMNDANYLGYNDWRLPFTIQPDPDCSNHNAAGQGYGSNCLASEMPYLYYELNGSTIQLTNINHISYWSGTAYEPNPSSGNWYYNFPTDVQNCCATTGYGSVMAVRVVPEPISSTLFLVGGATLGFRRFRQKFRK